MQTIKYILLSISMFLFVPYGFTAGNQTIQSAYQAKTSVVQAAHWIFSDAYLDAGISIPYASYLGFSSAK